MLHSRTLVLATLLFILLAVSVTLRMMENNTNTTESDNSEIIKENKIVDPEVVEETPVLPVPEVVPPSTVTAKTPTLAPVLPPVKAGNCFVGGCSGQVCSESADVMSTCEWREEYACYRVAVCERQNTGTCGWTETPELTSCLQTVRSSQESSLEVR